MSAPAVDRTTVALLAREYLRVSKDRSGRLKSADEQHQENEREAGAEGWSLGQPYLESGAISASRYGRKARPGFAALIADLEHDRFAADVLILWESSRGSRRVSEWARFLELLEERGVLMYVTSHGRLYDLSRSRDRHTLHEEGNDNARESDKISERVRRAMAAEAAQGRPHGRIPYGYRRRYDERTREMTAQEPDPVTAPVVREIFEGLCGGQTQRVLAMSLNQRGIRSPGGAKWTVAAVGRVARNPAYAGQRAHKSEPLIQGNWKPLVPLHQWQSVQAIMTDPSRRTWRPGNVKHLLSLIAGCGECGGPLTARFCWSEEGSYVCRDKGCVHILKGNLDEYVTALAVGRLARPDMIPQLATPDEKEVVQARNELEAARAYRQELIDNMEAMSVTAFTQAEPRALARIATAQKRLASLQVAPAILSVLSGPSVQEAWAEATVRCQRTVVRELIESVRVNKVPEPNYRGPVSGRVEIRWREAASA